MNNVTNLETKCFPMTLLINLDIAPTVVDQGNTYNNSENAVYLVNLIGYHKVKIVRFEVMRQTGGASSPLVLSLISPVFAQRFGNYRYPVFLIDRNVTTVPSEFPDVNRATNVSGDTEYIYNFDGNFPLFIGDLYQAYIGAQTFYQPQVPPRTLICVLQLSVEKL